MTYGKVPVIRPRADISRFAVTEHLYVYLFQSIDYGLWTAANGCHNDLLGSRKLETTF